MHRCSQNLVLPPPPLFTELPRRAIFSEAGLPALPFLGNRASGTVNSRRYKRLCRLPPSQLAEKVREVICAEWQGAGSSLESTVVYRRLLEEGVEVPSYQMSAILNAFKVGGLIAASLGPQREEEVRKHGDLLITSVSSDLCTSSS